jgi:hypothetical protein
MTFLVDAHATRVGVLGFSGGEPYPCPECLFEPCRLGSERGFGFDKVMSHGVWLTAAARLSHILTPPAACGFTGKLGLSVDTFHDRPTAQAAGRCRTATRAFDRDNIVSLSSAGRHSYQGSEPAGDLAREPDAVVEWSDVLGRDLLVSAARWDREQPAPRVALGLRR